MPPEQMQARVNRWGQPGRPLGAGESEGMWATKSEPRGRKAKLRGRGAEEGRAESTETRALATRPGPLWLGNVVSGPLICLDEDRP